jgi:hypothetical protein
MIKESKRSTIYLDSEIYRILKIKALETSCSVSDLVNIAVRHELAEDLEDLNDFKKRAKEPTISYENMLKELKADGKI